MLSTLRKQHPRLANNLLLAGVSLAGCGIAALVAAPDQAFTETLSLGTGYLAIFLVLVTLLIGPLNMLKVRKNPVNINFRRDAGIWSGVLAILHVIFSFQVYFDGNLLLYFLQKDGAPKLDLFSISNDFGLLSALVILFLLVLSNNFFLRRLKGKRWKKMQRFNYLLFGLALAHTFGQQISNSRNALLVYGVIGLAGAVVVAQSIGFVTYRRRAVQRKAGSAPVAVPAAPLQPAVVPAAAGGMGRRRFITVTGATLVSGFAAGVAVQPLVLRAYQRMTTDPDTVANVPASGATPAAASPAATATATPAATSAATSTPATPAATTSAASSSAKTATPAATSAAPAAAATSAAAVSGTVLAALSALPVGSVKQFRTPDTKENAFLVREEDGSVKAFSGVCTHEPYDLVYDPGIKQFYCALHGACFNTLNGGVTRRPARTALPALSVKVDGQGNIVYSAA